MSVLTRLRTMQMLGLRNVANVAVYRLGLRFAVHPARWVRAAKPKEPFFRSGDFAPAPAAAPDDWRTTCRLFSHIEARWPPESWFSNPLTGGAVRSPDRPWWEIPDFDPAAGDIKVVWEFSRFDWVVAAAQQARSGEQEALPALNVQLADWLRANPPYRGPNWKCGQEASIRVLHLACAALMLGQVHEPLPGLRALVRAHLARIAPTVQYAMAQDNNHGTSEAAALFVGGSWLAAAGEPGAGRYEAAGRRWLENRVRRLVEPQGTFSQYSLNYHRLLLDSLSFAETWRRALGRETFTPEFMARARAAAVWAYTIVDPVTGDAPNLGANDGARILPLTNTGYRDYRPSVQLAMALFVAQRAYPKGEHDAALRWLDVALPPQHALPPGTRVASEGGFAALRCGRSLALLRYPKFKFRPSQADALHLDLWVGSWNLLRDAGTFSYSADPAAHAYFSGTRAHNTVEFDDRDQMPRLGRFLFGDWIKTSSEGPLAEDSAGVSFFASYKDGSGCTHARGVKLGSGSLTVTDKVAGFARKAVLRWRLAPGRWDFSEDDRGVHVVNSQGHILTVTADKPLRAQLTTGWESRYYLQKSEVPVLEVEVGQAARLASIYRWQ